MTIRRMPSRLRGPLAVGALVGLTALLVAPPSAPAVHTASVGGDLLPDLRSFAPYSLKISWESGRKHLRFTTEIVNEHSGVMQIQPGLTTDCNGDGVSDRYAFQRIYQDQPPYDGYFVRRHDTAYREANVGCMAYHAEHDHWHFDDFASYELFSDAGVRRRISSKTTFCLRDSRQPYPRLPGSPGFAFFSTCSRNSHQGISVGWSDVYGSSLPGQSLDVTGLPPGYYCLRSTVDPLNKLAETENRDGAGELRILLVRNIVLAVSRSCGLPR